MKMFTEKLFILYYILSFFVCVHSNVVDECKLKDFEESVPEIDITIDRLKFKREDDVQKAVGNIYDKISALIHQFRALPENCQESSIIITEFLRDIKLLHECTNLVNHEEDSVYFLSGYDSDNASYFREKIECANSITPVSKKVEMYRALARISFLGDAEVNQDFFNKVKKLIDEVDAPTAKVLTEAMVLIAAKTIRIADSYKFHPELLIDLNEFDQTAGRQSAEKVGKDLSSKFGSESLEIIYHIPNLSLRCYAYLAICSKASKPPQMEDVLVYMVPHLMDVMQSSEFEHLDKEIRKELINAFEDLPQRGKALILGEMCIYYTSEDRPREKNIYIKRNSNGTMLDWIFNDSTDGNVNRKLISASPHAMQIFLPLNSTASEFWTEGEYIPGRWEMVPNGFDCSFKVDTHNLFICYNVGKLMLSPERVEILLDEDRPKVEEYNSRREKNCGQFE